MNFKKLLSVILTFFMLIGMITGSAIPVRAQGNVVKRTQPLVIGGRYDITYQSTDGSAKTVPHTTSVTDCAEGWSWDAITKSLTLAGIDFGYDLDKRTNASIQFYTTEEATVIVQDGTVNKIDASGLAGKSALSTTSGNLAIKGGGSLELINMGSSNTASSYPPLSIHEFKVTVSEATISATTLQYSAAVVANEFVIQSGSFTAKGGANGFLCDKITLNGGTLSATATVPNGKAMSSAPTLNDSVLQSSDAATTGWDKSTVSYDSLTEFTVGSYNYKIINSNSQAKTVALTGFAKGKSASTVTINDTVKYKGVSYQITAIADNAFYNKTKIKQLRIGNNISIIGKKSFYGCSRLTDVVISNKVSEIQDYAFYKCKSLKKMTIGTGIKKIGKHVFCHARNLKNLTIKSRKLTSIGKHNLYGCTNLKIKVPSSKVKAYTKLFKNQGQKKNVKITK